MKQPQFITFGKLWKARYISTYLEMIQGHNWMRLPIVIIFVTISFVSQPIAMAQELWLGYNLGVASINTGNFKFGTGVRYSSGQDFSIKYMKNISPKRSFGLVVRNYRLTSSLSKQSGPNTTYVWDNWQIKNRYLETRLLVIHSQKGSRAYIFESGIVISYLYESFYRERYTTTRYLPKTEVELSLPHRPVSIGIPFILRFSSLKDMFSKNIPDRLSMGIESVFWLTDFMPLSSEATVKLPDHHKNKFSLFSYGLKLYYRLR